MNEWADELKSFNDYKIQTNLVFKYAVIQNILKVNPIDNVTLPKQKNEITFDLEEEENQKFYSKDELRTFMDTIKDDVMVWFIPCFACWLSKGLEKGKFTLCIVLILTLKIKL